MFQGEFFSFPLSGPRDKKKILAQHLFIIQEIISPTIMFSLHTVKTFACAWVLCSSTLGTTTKYWSDIRDRRARILSEENLAKNAKNPIENFLCRSNFQNSSSSRSNSNRLLSCWQVKCVKVFNSNYFSFPSTLSDFHFQAFERQLKSQFEKKTSWILPHHTFKGIQASSSV